MVRRPVGVFLQVFLIFILTHPICGSARAEVAPVSSVEQAVKGVLSIQTYDWKGNFLYKGMGYFSSPDGNITTVVPAIEGGYFVEAIASDGSQYIIENINPLSQSSGLIFASTEEPPLDFTYIGKTAPFPGIRDHVWIQGYDSTSLPTLVKAVMLETRHVPGFTRYLYVRMSLPLGSPGNTVINDKGEAAGMVLLVGDGAGDTGILVSTDAIRSSYGVSGEIVSLEEWTEGLETSWLKQKMGLYLRGLASCYAGDFGTASDLLEKVADSRDPGLRKAGLVLGDCYRDMGKSGKAIDAYERGLDRTKKLNGYHLSLTRMYLKQKRLADARHLWEEKAQEYKGDATAIILLALLLEAAGNASEAQLVARKAVQADPENARAHGALGDILTRQGNFDEAYGALERSFTLRPYQNEFTGEFCYAAVRSGRYDRAIKVCNKAVRSGREKAQNLMHLGDACAASGMDTRALESYRLSVKQDPRNIGAWCRLGDLLAETAFYQEAVSTYMDALEVAPDSAWLRFKLGKLFYMMGDHGGAARQVQVLRSTNQALADQLSLRLAAGRSTYGQ